MVRSYWWGPVVGALAWAGLAAGQKAPPPTEHVLVVQEAGKAAEKCRVLKHWRDHAGSQVCQVQALSTGEIMTVVDPAEAGPAEAVRRVFRWGRSPVPPWGAPIAPPEATVLARPRPAPAPTLGAGPRPQKPAASAATEAAAPRPSLLRRVFQPSSPAAAAQAAKPDGPAVKPAVATSAGAAAPQAVKASAQSKGPAGQAVQAMTEPAKTGDWRQSWGTVERWAEPAPARPSASARRPPPRAEQVADDPLQRPEVYAPIKTAEEKRGRRAARPAPAAPAGGSQAASVPAGMQSVLAAQSPQLEMDDGPGPQATPAAAPAPAVAANAFSGREAKGPAALRTPPPPSGHAMAPMPMPPMPVPPAMGAGTPTGLANAFTAVGTSRPIPADFDAQPVVENGFTHHRPAPRPAAVAHDPAPARPMPAPGPAMRVPPAPALASGALPVEEGTAELVAILCSSDLPSQREYAAGRLAVCDPRAEPQAAAALQAAAKNDPAPAVRAACVKALGEMQKK